jgi:hypothetical protein
MLSSLRFWISRALDFLFSGLPLASIEIRNQPTAQRAPAIDPRSGSGSILLDATSREDLEGRRDRDVSAIIHSRMFT